MPLRLVVSEPWAKNFHEEGPGPPSDNGKWFPETPEPFINDTRRFDGALNMLLTRSLFKGRYAFRRNWRLNFFRPGAIHNNLIHGTIVVLLFVLFRRPARIRMFSCAFSKKRAAWRLSTSSNPLFKPGPIIIKTANFFPIAEFNFCDYTALSDRRRKAMMLGRIVWDMDSRSIRHPDIDLREGSGGRDYFQIFITTSVERHS